MTSRSLLLMPAPAIRPTLVRATASAAGCLLLLLRSRARCAHPSPPPNRSGALSQHLTPSPSPLGDTTASTHASRDLLFVYSPPRRPPPPRRATVALPTRRCHAAAMQCDAMS